MRIFKTCFYRNLHFEAIQSFLLNNPIGNLLKVYIDPGHGGADGGTSGNGLKEKELNLTISMYQRQFFQEAGYTVKMARYGDTNKSLQQRTLEANQWGADLYISNHINACLW